MRRLLPSALAAAAAALLAPGAAHAAVSPPAPTGPAPVGFARQTLVDHHRVESLVPGGGPRRVPVRVWYPAAAPGDAPAQVLTPAEQRAWESLDGVPPASLDGLGAAATSGAPPAPGRHRVLLLSHGLGETTAFLTNHATELASRGYVVVGIDHPGDSSAVEVAPGRLAASSPATTRHKVRAVATRVADLHFVAGRLRTLRGVGRLRVDRVGAFGHSMGGAASAGAMLADRRIAAGVDMDGALFGPVVRRGLDAPFGTMAQAGTPLGLYRGSGFWRRLRGPHPLARFAGTLHHGFTDYVWLAPQLGVDPAAADVGTVDPVRAVAEQNAFLLRFFRRHLPA